MSSQVKESNIFLIKVLSKTPLLKKINNLQNRILQVCPYDQETVERYAARIIKMIFVLSVFGTLVTLAGNYLILKKLDWYTFANCILLIHVIIKGISSYSINRLLDNINDEFGLFLSRMKNEYRASRSIIQSLQTASVGFSMDIQRHVKEIEDILCAENTDALVQTYITNPYRHPYIRMFVKLCHQCMNKGDMVDKITEVSVFSKNIEILRTEVADLVLHNKKRRYKLLGLTWICILPCMFLNLFGMWGGEFTTGNTTFYNSYGHLVKMAALVTTWYVFNIIQRTKDMGHIQGQQVSSIYFRIKDMFRITPKHKFAKQLKTKLEAVKNNTPVAVFYTKMIVYGAIGVAFMFVFIFYSNETSQRNILSDSDISSVPTTVYTEDDIRTTILSLSKEYKDYHMSEVSDEQILYDINGRIRLTNMYVKEAMINEIRTRVRQYQEIEFMWWQMLLCVCGASAGFVPLWDLNYTYSIYKKNKKDELKLFQIIILLNKDFPTTTTLSILESMESQALFYKPILVQALTEYQSNSQKALYLLKAEQDEAFQNIVNNLISIDKVGAKRAFSEIETDIIYTEKRKQIEESIADENEKALLDILSVLPAIIVIGGYFIAPFVLDSWTDLKSMFELFESMQ